MNKGLLTEIAELKANIWKQAPDYKETLLWQDDLRFADTILAKFREVVEGAGLNHNDYISEEEKRLPDIVSFVNISNATKQAILRAIGGDK